MNDYVLLTDSSADLTDALVKELGVEVLPLSFTMRNKTYRNWPDNREIDPKDFYRQLREGEMATTSAVNVSDFTETIEPHLKEGRDVLVVAFSSGLSATCHSAQIAAQELSEQYPERKVYVVDSLCASLGQGLLLWHAAQHKARGESIEAVRDWVLGQKKLLITDTTMRDAHQSLLSTRVRTRDMLKAAEGTAEILNDCFSLEMWGGATFDVAYRFLHESPWERLRLLREKIPNIPFQMLLRGANAVGYTNYPDNLIRAFIRESARSGIDVFRIFDSLNWIPGMEIAIDEVLQQGKLCEATLCSTGDSLDPKRAP